MQQVYTLKDILGMDKIPRLNFMNTISGFKSANLIGTVDEEKNYNLAIFSSVIHLGSKPPYFGFISRPASVERHTLSNILQTKHYTINHINKANYQQAHQTSGNYPKGTNEFEKVGLQMQFINSHKAPFVANSNIKLAMELVETHHITANDTVMVVGKLLFVSITKSTLPVIRHVKY